MPDGKAEENTRSLAQVRPGSSVTLGPPLLLNGFHRKG